MAKTWFLMFVGLPLAITGCSDIPDFGGGVSVKPDVTFVVDSDATESGDVPTKSAGMDPASGGGDPGIFTGKVVMTGEFTPLELLIKKGANVKNPEVCSAVDIPDERLVLGSGNSVKGVFIYLTKAPKGGKTLDLSETPFSFDQKNCQFDPHCAVVPVGQIVKVLSNDPIAHNTHTYPQKNPSVNALVDAGDREGKLEFIYKKSESVPLSVKCDLHTWMTAYQLPIDHPYAAVTDENGEFSIKDLPVGKHSFVVWHEAANGGFVERKFAVEIKSGETTTMQIDYPADRLKL